MFGLAPEQIRPVILQVVALAVVGVLVGCSALSVIAATVEPTPRLDRLDPCAASGSNCEWRRLTSALRAADPPGVPESKRLCSTTSC